MVKKESAEPTPEDKSEEISLLLRDAEISETNVDIDNEQSTGHKLIELINAINGTLFGKQIEQKSKLNQTTARGIKRALALNDYMDKEYNYRYKSLDALVNSTLTINKSINGHGFDKAVEALKGLSTTIELNELRGSTLNDRMIGRR